MKRTNSKRLIISFGLCAAMVMAAAPAVSAEARPAQPQGVMDILPMPRYDLMVFARSKLTNNKDGTADIYVTTNGNMSVTQIDVKVVLQKKIANKWTEVDSFSATEYGSDLIMTETVSVGSGTYRLYSKFTYYGSKTETHENYSSEITC